MELEEEVLTFDFPDVDEPLDEIFGRHTPPAPALSRIDPVDAEQVIADMVALIVERFAPQQIILFGSRARGTARPRSDIDLLVVFPEVCDKRETAIAISDYLFAAALPKDILLSTPGELAYEQPFTGSVLDRAVRGGIVLYDHRSPYTQDHCLAALCAGRSQAGHSPIDAG